MTIWAAPCRISVACVGEIRQSIRNAHRDGTPQQAAKALRSGTRLFDPRRRQGARLSGPPDKATGAPRGRYSWNWIGFALSATIVGISIYVLAGILHDIDFARVVTNVCAMPASRIGWATFFVAGAYATLTCYDLFALRTIGANHVPYRIAALASLTSYAIGHNIGATAVSGGAIRYRIYSRFGLRVVDVAKICFLTGLTFWLGNLAVLGSGMAYRPDVSG